MRQVIVFEEKAIPDDVYSGQRIAKVERFRGTFHRWGSAILGQTVAIVERTDGTVENVAADMIKFIEPLRALEAA